MSPRLSAYLMLLIVSVIWGVAGPVIKFTLHDFPPLIFLSYRFAISGVIALVYFATTKTRFPSKPKDIGLATIYSIFAVTLALGLLFFGFDKTTSLTGTLLSAMAPIIVVAAGAIFLKEHVTKIERAGITIAFAGTLITVAGPLFSGSSGSVLGSLEGNGLIILSIFVDAVATLAAKVMVRDRFSPTTLTHFSFIIGFVSIFPFALMSHSWPAILQTIQKAPITAHSGIWFMAIASGTLAYSLRNRALKTIEMGETTVFSYLYPIWAAPLSIFWLGEKLTVPFIVGACIIAAGVYIAENKRRHKHSPKRAVFHARRRYGKIHT
ncbi:DMT family transporter [Candidatus Gottesmanbacteria bacterium]|nr:DMT family transporter [Candidatus Gottesmanbacteria bacterium]